MMVIVHYPKKMSEKRKKENRQNMTTKQANKQNKVKKLEIIDLNTFFSKFANISGDIQFPVPVLVILIFSPAVETRESPKSQTTA